MKSYVFALSAALLACGCAAPAPTPTPEATAAAGTPSCRYVDAPTGSNLKRKSDCLDRQSSPATSLPPLPGTTIR